MFKFRIVSMADSDYAKCPVTRRSVSGCATFLEGIPLIVNSVMQKVVALSVAEAETITRVQCVQDMLYCKGILESMGLQVEQPIVLYISTAVDLKEAGVLTIKWLKGDENQVDTFTKNLAGPAYNKGAKFFVGEDSYNKE
eukprot:592154-Ditylum_brightwellii.AAC.1